jgi:hypothetical protein
MVLANKIPKEYKPKKNRDEVVTSAYAGIKLLLSESAKNIILVHKKELLTILLWKLTGLDGKYNCRYATKGSLENLDKEIQHEHVYTRKEIIEELLEKPDDYKEILSKAVACIVLKEEHDLLSKLDDSRINGFERYKKCGLTVIDRLTGKAIDLH